MSVGLIIDCTIITDRLFHLTKTRSPLVQPFLETQKLSISIQEKRRPLAAALQIRPTPSSFSSATLPDPRVMTTCMLWRRRCLNSNGMGARSFSLQMGLGKMGWFGGRQIRFWIGFLPTAIQIGQSTDNWDCEGCLSPRWLQRVAMACMFTPKEGWKACLFQSGMRVTIHSFWVAMSLWERMERLSMLSGRIQLNVLMFRIYSPLWRHSCNELTPRLNCACVKL